MRKRYKQILKAFFHHKLFHTRVDVLDITQEEMAHRLVLSSRSYVDLDHGILLRHCASSTKNEGLNLFANNGAFGNPFGDFQQQYGIS